MLEPGLLQSATVRKSGSAKDFGNRILLLRMLTPFYVRVVKPLRRFRRQGVVERLQEITPTDDRSPIGVEIIGQVDLTK